jgi:hypothetical protein
MFEGRNEVPFVFMDNVYIQRPSTLYLGKLRSSLLSRGIPDDVTILNLCIGIRIQIRAAYISQYLLED